MKKRISLTIDNELLKQVDEFIDGSTIQSRSRAVEMLLRKAITPETVTQAFVLAGGEGTRLRPLTYELPKPLFPLDGKPIAEHLIDRLRAFGMKNILLSVGHKAEKVISHFGDGSKFGVSINYVIESEPLGTGGPLRLAPQMLKSTFLMMNGDVITNMDFRDMIAFHKDAESLATIALVQVKDPERFGVVELKGNRITRFVEKPKKGESTSRLINAGVYVLNKEIIKHIPDGHSMIEDVFSELAPQGILSGYVCSGEKTYWTDIGTQDSYAKVIRDLRKGKLDWLK